MRVELEHDFPDFESLGLVPLLGTPQRFQCGSFDGSKILTDGADDREQSFLHCNRVSIRISKRPQTEALPWKHTFHVGKDFT